jgi:DNA-binding CsgD family transcriptional regulator
MPLKLSKSLFLFNAYIYFIFRDKTYFYYLLTQIGGIVYTLGTNKYFSQLMTPRYVQAVLVDRRVLGTYDFNDILTRLATTLILFTFVQLTRTYLNTKEHLPKWDKILRVMNVGFLVAMCAVMTWALFFFNFSTVIVDNLWAISTVLTILYVTFLRYRQKDKAARYYLIANSIALGIILFLGIFLLVNPVIYNNAVFQLANIAVVAQAFCLALALVQRLLLIRDELKQKQLEIKALQLKNDLITSENLLQKTQNDLLEEKLSSSARELASTTLYMSQKNEMLADLRVHVQSLNKNLTDEGKTTIKKIEMVIQNNSYLDADWERFRIHFERVHPLFFENLQAEHPTLTKNEIRLCAYFHLNLSTKEIAALLNIDPASVRKAKMRLNKKMNGKEEEIGDEMSEETA